jgi:hypothetical protein
MFAAVNKVASEIAPTFDAPQAAYIAALKIVCELSVKALGWASLMQL